MPISAHGESKPTTGNPDFVLLGAGVIPEFEGSDTVDATPLLALRLNRGHRYITFQGTSLSANLIDNARWESGPRLNYLFARDDAVDSAVIAALDEIDAAIELGVFVAWTVRPNSSLVDAVRI